jgi:hypothetical protein
MNPTVDLSAAIWVKSSYSNGDGGQCVEWAPGAVVGLVPVRDSKDPEGPALIFSSVAWSAFVDAVRAGGVSDRLSGFRARRPPAERSSVGLVGAPVRISVWP